VDGGDCRAFSFARWCCCIGNVASCRFVISVRESDCTRSTTVVVVGAVEVKAVKRGKI
jgi:hypothetical protein